MQVFHLPLAFYKNGIVFGDFNISFQYSIQIIKGSDNGDSDN